MVGVNTAVSYKHGLKKKNDTFSSVKTRKYLRLVLENIWSYVTQIYLQNIFCFILLLFLNFCFKIFIFHIFDFFLKISLKRTYRLFLKNKFENYISIVLYHSVPKHKLFIIKRKLIRKRAEKGQKKGSSTRYYSIQTQRKEVTLSSKTRTGF